MTEHSDVNTGAARRKKLGRGLGALMGDIRGDEPVVRFGTVAESAETDASAAHTSGSNTLKSVEISAISPLAGQPRTHFDETALGELAESIRTRGVIQPIIVRPKPEGRYELVAGERRWRAAQKAQLHQIPALVRELDDREVMALALIENLQREDLNPVEEARAYRRLSEEEGMTQAEIAAMVDKSRSHVANMQRLLDLPDGVLGLVATGALSMGHARALIGNANASTLARRAADEKMSVREIERLVRRDSRPPSAAQSQAVAESGNADIAAVQSHLEDFLGMPVRIVTEKSPQQGTVTIRYRTLDQLDLVCQRLTGGDI
ncbi:MAG TPA: ParB/RepB/Spo0J family partition protein [Qipengyuania sp.]|nr:ParB/RepB/Spo0J family partition protein [Qipengyuania sp.]